MNFFKKSKLLAITLLFVMGCNSSYTPSHKTNNSFNAPSVPEENKLISWSLVKDYSLISCQVCHSGSVAPDLSNHAQVTQSLDKILSEVMQNEMPPNDSGFPLLNLCQQKILLTWANATAPDVTNVLVGSIDECRSQSPSPTPPPLPSPSPTPLPAPSADVFITWDLINKKVLNSCQSCHGSGTYGNYKNTKANINGLLAVVESNRMPPSTPLSDCQKWILRTWKKENLPLNTTIPLSNNPICHLF